MAYRDGTGVDREQPVMITYGPLTRPWGLFGFAGVLILLSLVVGSSTTVLLLIREPGPVFVGYAVSLLLLGVATACFVGFLRFPGCYRLSVDSRERRLTVQRLRFGRTEEERIFDVSNVVDVRAYQGSKKLSYDSGTSKPRPAGTIHLVSRDGRTTSITGELVHGMEVHLRTADRLREALRLDSS